MVRWHRDERGAVAPFVAILMVVLVGLASFAVDIGYQRVAARDMQAVADIVAMDMARKLDGKSTSALMSQASWNAAVQESLSRNDDRAVGDSLTVVTCAASRTTVDAGQICATPGIYEPNNGSFRDSGTAAASHVRVITSTSVDYFFPVFASDGAVHKRAYAESQGGGCIQLGSYAARLDTDKSPLLGQLLGALGTGVSLSAADYNALAGADIDLLGLVNAPLGAVTLQQAITTNQGISLAGFYLAAADVLKAESGATAAVSALQALAVGVPGLTIPAGELLSLGTGGSSGLGADLNVLDLVTAAAAVAGKNAGLSIPQLGINLPVVGNVTASLSAFEGLKPYCGRPRDAEDPNVQPGRSAAATLTLNSNLLPISVPGLLNTKVRLTGVVKAASATAKISAIKCDPTRVRVKVQDGLLDVNLTLEILTEVKLAFIPLVKVSGPITIKGTTTSSGEPEITVLTDEDFDKGHQIAGSGSGLPHLTVSTAGLTPSLLGLDIPLGDVLDAVLGPLLSVVVNPLVQGLDEALLAPLLGLLGLDVSGADVRISRTPTCSGVALRG